MAYHEIDFSCGHTARVYIEGKGQSAQAESRARGICPSCWLAEKKAAEAKKVAAAAELGLPELTGTQKQVAWGNAIRAKWAARQPRAALSKKLDQGRVAWLEEMEKKFSSLAPETQESYREGYERAVWEINLIFSQFAKDWIEARGEIVANCYIPD